MATEKRLIDANALIEYIKDRMRVTYPNLYPGMFKANEIIKNFSTVDAVEVVRCKDCKHCAVASWGERYCARSRFVQLDDLAEDDFCSYGEGKDNGL